MKELILMESVPAKLTFNLDEYRAGIRSELEKYDVVVTVDTVKDAKDLAANLNKAVKSLKDDFKAASKVVTDPVDQIGVQVSEIVSEILESREKLTTQIKKFEDERKATVGVILSQALHAEWDKQGVVDEFKRSSISGLIKLTAITAKDKPTSSSAQAIVTMVSQDKALQDQTEKRLLMLENESYKAGLKAPLTRAHVSSFLFCDEEEYQGNLAGMIQSEIQRQEVAEQAMRASIEKEQAKTEVPSQDIPVQETTVVEEKQDPVEEPKETPQSLINHVNAMTGRTLMGLGLTKAQAVKVMEEAYNGNLYGLRMVY